ncbi:MAG: VWA domain-containing protein [Myxococcaceae bacterium]|nr:VWA domain-containing protein [Myxococcaceae bacterium]
MNDPLTLTASLDRPRLAKGQPTTVHLVAELVAPPAAATRAPLELVLALDTSGSMEGEKLRHLVTSVELLLQQLQPYDRVGLVAFSQTARILLPLAAPADARNAVRGLHADGGTNVEAGLRHAASLLGRKNPEARQGVLVLTDGLPNAGAVTPRTLAAVVRDLGLNVSTLGYGADHAEDVLISLAEAGRGTYAHVPAPELCRVELARAVGSHAEVVAEGVTLDFEPRRKVTVERVLGAPLPDFLAGQRRPVAFVLKLDGFFDDGPATLGRLVLKQRPSHVIEREVTADIAATSGPLDAKAHGLRLRCTAKHVRAHAAQLADARRFDEAKAELDRVIEEIRNAPAASNDLELGEALEQLIDDATLMQQRPDAAAQAAYRRGQQSLGTATPASALLASALGQVPNARLIVLEGADPREVTLQGETLLGRTAEADVQLQSSSVSRRHTRIVASDGTFWVNDLGSTNCTRLNGRPVRCERLRNGDVIHVGQVKLLFREG